MNRERPNENSVQRTRPRESRGAAWYGHHNDLRSLVEKVFQGGYRDGSTSALDMERARAILREGTNIAGEPLDVIEALAETDPREIVSLSIHRDTSAKSITVRLARESGWTLLGSMADNYLDRALYDEIRDELARKTPWWSRYITVGTAAACGLPMGALSSIVARFFLRGIAAVRAADIAVALFLVAVASLGFGALVGSNTARIFPRFELLAPGDRPTALKRIRWVGGILLTTLLGIVASVIATLIT
jgi:hypothetical protein